MLTLDPVEKNIRYKMSKDKQIGNCTHITPKTVQLVNEHMY